MRRLSQFAGSGGEIRGRAPVARVKRLARLEAQAPCARGDPHQGAQIGAATGTDARAAKARAADGALFGHSAAPFDEEEQLFQFTHGVVQSLRFAIGSRNPDPFVKIDGFLTIIGVHAVEQGA